MTLVTSNKKLKDIKLMLLGPGKDLLDYRKQVKQELTEMGYSNVLIMEELSDEETDCGIDEKFERIIKEYDPTLFIAFFHKNVNHKPVKMDAVIFEIGYICCRYGSHHIGKRLRLLAEKSYDWDKTTAYIKTLFPKLPRDEFDETKVHSKASYRIHLFVLNLF